MSEMIRRRFHADVRGLKKRCKSLDVALHDFYNACDTDVCILSSDEYEIGNSKVDCSPENENYFVSEDNYLTLTAQF
jgi:hypothetical protein